MDKQTFFFILFKLYCKILILSYFYHFVINFFKYNNKNKDISQKPILNTEIIKIEKKQEKKYEEKYLNEIRKLNKEFIFDDKEIEIEIIQFNKFLKLFNQNYSENLEKLNKKLNDVEVKLFKYEENNEEYEEFEEFYEEHKELNNYFVTIQYLLRLKEIYNEELNEFKELNKEDQNCLHKKAKEMAHDFIIKQRLEKLKNCYIIEYTPLGNVLMIYDINCESFQYYSDNIIPYRFLEVVARKYVKQFNCRPIFVDMEEEIKLAEEKWEKEKDDENKNKENFLEPIQEKKNVFAKFKSYNNESGTGYINTVGPPKNSIPNKKLTEEQKNEKLLLKEKSNRYTYEGKFANFNFIKKIDRKIVDKKFQISFADFKHMKKEKII
jgi:hypothetical protein